MRPQDDAKILFPRDDVFENKSVIESTMLNHGQKFPVFDRVEYPETGGILVHYKGMPYPKRGFPYPEAIWQNDILKRITQTLLKAVGIRQMIIPMTALALLPWKTKIVITNNILRNYSRIATWLLLGTYLKDNRYSDTLRPMRKIAEQFLKHLGIDPDVSREIAQAITNMIEYDDAYRYRFEDIMSEASRTALIERPYREIKRLGAIFKKRELIPQVAESVGMLVRIFSLLTLHPRIRRSWRYALSLIDIKEFSRMGIDNMDRYQVLRRGDYNFTGRTFEERAEIYKDAHRVSQCCEKPVNLSATDSSMYICSKCGKQCLIGYLFPPEVEIAQQP